MSGWKWTLLYTLLTRGCERYLLDYPSIPSLSPTTISIIRRPGSAMSWWWSNSPTEGASTTRTSSSTPPPWRFAAFRPREASEEKPVAAISSSSSAATLVSPTARQVVHVIVLVHGWMGNHREMGYLQDTLLLQSSQRLSTWPDPETVQKVVVYSSRANDGKTWDGIAAGGRRLAAEIDRLLLQQQQQQQQQEATTSPASSPPELSLSLVGNSLGGLYARYALAEIQALQPEPRLSDSIPRVRPAVFATTATPHLGVAQHTYVQLPSRLENWVAQVLGRTGRDLFRRTDVIRSMTTEPRFLQPLQRFQLRLAYANMHSTDFQVPTATAAFVTPTGTSIHRPVELPTPSPEAARLIPWMVQTDPQPDRLLELMADSDDGSTDDLAQRLDALGWTKVVCDVREHLPRVPLPTWRTTSSSSSSSSRPATDPSPPTEETARTTFTSQELYSCWADPPEPTTTTTHWYVPLGHMVLVANSKDALARRWNAGGRPIMDHLATQILNALRIMPPPSPPPSSSSSSSIAPQSKPTA